MGASAELKPVGEAMVSFLSSLRNTTASATDGRSMDYAATERLLAERSAAIGRNARRCILGSLDIDRPKVVHPRRVVLAGRPSLLQDDRPAGGRAHAGSGRTAIGTRRWSMQ
jgi:hypothetical protein